MKKNIILLILIFLCSCSVFSKDLFDWQINISTGFPAYGQLENSKTEIKSSESYKRIFLGSEIDLFFNVTNPVKFYLGADANLDFLYDKPKYHNSIDYSFLAGIEIFPLNDYGLNIQIAYLLGHRSDFVQTEDSTRTFNSRWGNGFKLGTHYEFLRHEKVTLRPVLGLTYKYVPRGNYTNNHYFSAEIGFKF